MSFKRTLGLPLALSGALFANSATAQEASSLKDVVPQVHTIPPVAPDLIPEVRRDMGFSGSFTSSDTSLFEPSIEEQFVDALSESSILIKRTRMQFGSSFQSSQLPPMLRAEMAEILQSQNRKSLGERFRGEHWALGHHDPRETTLARWMAREPLRATGQDRPSWLDRQQITFSVRIQLGKLK